MGKQATKAAASLMDRCAKYLLRVLRKHPPEVQQEAGKPVAAAYIEGSMDTGAELVKACKDARARNPSCASCPALCGVEDIASDIVAQCHGAAAEHLKS